MSQKRVPHSERSFRARAAAIVEFAVVLPLLLMILMGIIEYGYVFMNQQILTNAAREGCRVAVLQTTDEPYDDVTNRVGEILDSAGLSGYTITMTHVMPTETVTVSVPYDNVSLLGDITYLFGTRPSELTGTCSMRKEGVAAGGGS